MSESSGRLDKRGRFEIRKRGIKSKVWGQICCESTEIGAMGTFTTEAKRIPFGTVVEILVPVNGFQQMYNNTGKWKFFDRKNIYGFLRYTIQRV